MNWQRGGIGASRAQSDLLGVRGAGERDPHGDVCAGDAFSS